MKFTPEQAEFVKEEFGLEYPADTENPMQLKTWRLIKDACFMIECSDTDKDGPTTDRGRIATSICDMRY